MTRDEFLAALVADITDRQGLKHEWNSIDDDVKAEIMATWGGLTDRLLAAARAEAIAELRAGVDVEACARAGYESDPGWRYQWDGINMYATTRDAHIRIARAVLRAAKVLP